MNTGMNELIGFAAFGLAATASGQGAPALAFDPLPYAYDALEPYIDARTMEIHYSKHHQTYFNNLTKAVSGTELDGKSLESLFPKISQLPVGVRNNGGGHWNHAFFWKSMAPKAGGAPSGTLGEAISKAFGSFDEFKKQFEAAAVGRFGSGWAWLAVGADGKLFVSSTPNQDNPLMDVAEKRGTPILGLDVWEHAYYLKYQNLRASYASAFWNVVHWPAAMARYEATRT
jgi:superoxide dismutase, Fe-Mn family